ncbi:TPA: hypothetical protein EYP66_05880 [Candidatus Poribacteria bacterium]|nr:hypothetical protein [Candidatus Poribacteria bacterium]
MKDKSKEPKLNSQGEKIIGAPIVYLKGTGKMITFKKFVKHWEANKPKKADVLARINAILRDYEKKYGMTTEEFVKNIYGTPAEDTADFLDWGMAYRASLRLTSGNSEDESIIGKLD